MKKILLFIILLLPLLGFSQAQFGKGVTSPDSIKGKNIYATDTITSADSVMVIGGMNIFYKNRTIADDSYLTPTTAINGRGWVMVSNSGTVAEWADFYFSNDGTVVLIQNSANVVTVDTDDKLVIKDNGTGITIENRLGGSRTIKVRLEY